MNTLGGMDVIDPLVVSVMPLPSGKEHPVPTGKESSEPHSWSGHCGKGESIVSIVTSYRLDDQEIEVRDLAGSRMFTSPCYGDWLLSLTSFLPNGYWGFFPQR
jgi:hypothetical protein